MLSTRCCFRPTVLIRSASACFSKSAVQSAVHLDRAEIEALRTALICSQWLAKTRTTSTDIGFGVFFDASMNRLSAGGDSVYVVQVQFAAVS